MIKRKVKNRMLFIYIISTIGLVLLIASLNMNYLYHRLNEYDGRVFDKIEKEVKKAQDIQELVSELEKSILERDVVLITDFESKKIIRSINLVIEEKHEAAINGLVEIDDSRIKLDRSKSNLSNVTYVNDFSVKSDELFQMTFGDDVIVYFIPKWRTRLEPYYTGILISFSITCFFLTFVTLLLESKRFNRYFMSKTP